MPTDSTTVDSLPPYLAAMARLFEDDVTAENVEQHIAEYEAKLEQHFYPMNIHTLRPFRERFYKAVRAFAAYEVGGRGNGTAAH